MVILKPGKKGVGLTFWNADLIKGGVVNSENLGTSLTERPNRLGENSGCCQFFIVHLIFLCTTVLFVCTTNFHNIMRYGTAEQ